MKKIILSIFVLTLSFSGVSAATVISGEVGGAGGGQVVDHGEPAKLDFSVRTDKRVYDLGQGVNIKISAKADKPVTLKFNSGCQANYEIRREGGDTVYNFIASALCTMALTERELPVEWEFTHTTSEKPLSPGKYEVVAEVLGHGQAIAKFSVAADGVVPENTGNPDGPEQFIGEAKAKEIALNIVVSEGIPADDWQVVLYESTDQNPAFYEVVGEKSVKILNIFKVEMVIRARILATDGEVIQVKKPWWSVFVL